MEGKKYVFYGLEPIRGQSTTAVSEANYRLLYSNATEFAKTLTTGCTRPQPVTDNGVRDGR